MLLKIYSFKLKTYNAMPLELLKYFSDARKLNI